MARPRSAAVNQISDEAIYMSSESRIPRILEQAPDFKAKSTHGVIQLSDYTG